MVLSIVLFVLFGFIVGLVARLLAAGPTSPVETYGVGMAGAVIGGLLAHRAGWMRTPWSLPGFLVALAGAVLLIVVARTVRSAAT